MVQVIQRAMDILEFVARHGKEPVRLNQIAEHANLSQPTTANIVKTLVHTNYLEQVGRNIGYRLGLAAYQLTGNPSFDQDLISAAKEPMEALTKQLNETCLLAVIRNNKRMVLYQEESDQMLQVRTPVVAEAYSTATGRLLVAYLTPKQLDNLIKAIGLPTKKVWPGGDTRESLETELSKIREEKFVQIVSVHHTIGFAVPVYQNAQVLAGLSVFIPQSRYTEINKTKITKLLRKAANQITRVLENIKT